MIIRKFTFGSVIVSSLLMAPMYGTDPVSAANSTIDFPHDQAYINTNQPTIIGTVRDAKNAPLSGLEVQIVVDGIIISTVKCDEYGIYRFYAEAGIADGAHDLIVYDVASQTNIASSHFVIDTIAPDTFITYPANGATLTSSTVVFTGTTEAGAMVEVFVDGDTFGNVCYADDSGNWSIEYDNLANGSHAITAQSTDIAGNQGYVSDITNFSINV